MNILNNYLIKKSKDYTILISKQNSDDIYKFDGKCYDTQGY